MGDPNGVIVTTDSPSYGLRFFNELRHLTASTCGLTHADILKLQAMGQHDVERFVATHMQLTWCAPSDATPEQLAAAVLRDIRERDDQRKSTALAEQLLTALLAPFLPWP